MKSYTFQIGEGTDEEMSVSVHSESLFADSLGEAIEKAKAITKHRPPHQKETTVRIVESGADEHPLWASSAEDVRNA